jgi:hypothetical protein
MAQRGVSIADLSYRIRGTNLLLEELRVALKNGDSVTVSLGPVEEEKKIFGFVKKVGRTDVVLAQLTVEGCDDGIVVFPGEQITRLSRNGIEERNRQIIYSASLRGK